MKTLFAVLALVSLSSAANAALSCTLTDADYASLAASDSHLDRGSVQSLDAQSQADLCATRTLWHKILKSGSNLTTIDDYVPTYLTPAENKRVDQTIDAILTRRLSRGGVAVA
ncbi:MAG: hypothetical protein KGL74_10660 [Elusimicrobia bacterium]|nr:hypothetical protein [Elusimicrobiota bacterium]